MLIYDYEHHMDWFYKYAVVLCPSISNPLNGVVSMSNSGYYPSTATYTCNSGYALSNSSYGSIGCQATGSLTFWASSPPTCDGLPCPPLTNPDNGQVTTSNGARFPSTATYSCNNGFILSNSSLTTIACQFASSVTSWVAAPPNCNR